MAALGQIGGIGNTRVLQFYGAFGTIFLSLKRNS